MLVTPTGDPLVRDRLLTDAEAATLRAYKRILAKYGYREQLWCQICDADDVEFTPSGCRAYVTGTQIAILCRHLRRFYSGSTA